MKKFLMIALVFVVMLSCVSCGGGDANDSGSGANNKKGGGGIAEEFFNIFASGNYHMKAKMVGDDGYESTMESYYKNGMVATHTEMGGESSRMIHRDGKMYIIMDAEKMYMVYDTPEVSGTSSGDAIETEGMTRTGSGTDEFNGKNLSYEEYSDGEGNKAQYFMDGSNLAGIRNIFDGGKIDIIILVLDKNVPDSVFEIPSGYEKVGF